MTYYDIFIGSVIDLNSKFYFLYLYIFLKLNNKHKIMFDIAVSSPQ